MAKSSIHIEAGNIGFFSHNDRSRPTKNSIFSDEENFVNCSSKEAIGLFKKELEIRTAAYLKNHPTRKKLHSRTHTHLSAIVNLNKEHTPVDLYRVCDYLEKIFDTKVLQFSIHKDEGRVSDDGKTIKNYHAHIEMMGLDSNGNSIKRQLHRKELISLQSATAELLGMERGTNYTKEKKPRPKRLDTYEYKEAKKQESKAKRATGNQLKAEIKQLKAKLQERGAERSDYAELEAFNRELKERIKAKDLTVEDLKKEITNQKERKEFHKTYKLKYKNELIEAQETILKHKATISSQKESLSSYEQNMIDLEVQNKELQSEVTQTLASNEELNFVITSLNAERSDEERALKQELQDISDKITESISPEITTSLEFMTKSALEKVELFLNKTFKIILKYRETIKKQEKQLKERFTNSTDRQELRKSKNENERLKIELENSHKKIKVLENKLTKNQKNVPEDDEDEDEEISHGFKI